AAGRPCGGEGEQEEVQGGEVGGGLVNGGVGWVRAGPCERAGGPSGEVAGVRRQPDADTVRPSAQRRSAATRSAMVTESGRVRRISSRRSGVSSAPPDANAV